MTNAVVVHGGEHELHKFIVTANCFFFPSMKMGTSFREWEEDGREIAVRPGRIEVTDADAPLHSHEGFTVVFIASGQGVFKTVDIVPVAHGIVRPEQKTYTISAGDVLLIPPHALHASIAAPNTVMVEYSIFVGDPQNFEALDM